MEVSIQSMGDSVGVPIPKSLLRQVGFEDRVEIEVEGDTLVLRRPVELSSDRDAYKQRHSDARGNGDEEFTEFVDPELEEDDEKDW